MNPNDIISIFCDDAENKINTMINNIESVYILLEDDYLDKFEEAIKILNKKKAFRDIIICSTYWRYCKQLL